ncbi:MAG: organomercurial lyase [Armatimonadota bacterium]
MSPFGEALDYPLKHARVDPAKLNELADRIAAAVPRSGPTDRKIAVQVYRLLAEGKPVSPQMLASALGLSEIRVRDTLAGWPGIYYDGEGAIVAFWGLALPEMPHRFEVDGRTLYTWCAWDSLFIPGILGKIARVESTDPITKERISLVVGPDRIRQVNPAGTMVSFLAPKVPFDADVIQSFCHFVHFFGTADAGARWVSEHPTTLLLSADEAHELGRLTNERNFKEALAPSA